MASAIVLSHLDVADELGHIGGWLDRHGYRVRRIQRGALPVSLDGDLLISLGSPSSVAEGHMGSEAAAEVELVTDWVSAGRPFIGVCFGAQVLARALGGSVARMPNTFRAYRAVELGPSAPSGLDGRWAVWHEDAISAPTGSEVLATLPHADAVFRNGRAWGVQPHIEFDSSIVRRLAETMSVPAGEWESLYEDLKDDDSGHAKRSAALLDAMSVDW